ncbi:ABC transporter permease [Desulfofalx alkaliphila]|uniref:ABC transporter permease n=1 Tax=Desulfofalx alkaliphila TaxID=105483 RepID=UPI0004E13D21|nr:ABC transporter permease [Desulfofalx alkaliphila]
MIISNPVLLKELRQRFRTIKTPAIIFLYLLVIGSFTLGIIYLNDLHSGHVFDPYHSKEIFIILSVSQLILLGFVTPGLTAGTISGERERQTLNVLLTTQLSPMSIVVGKMISSCAFTLLLVLSTLPLYSIVFIYGGVAPAQLLGVFGFYLVTMFLFAAIGIACSTYFKRTGISTVTAYGFTAFLGAGTAFLGAFIYDVTRRNVFPRPEDIPLSVQFLFDINPVIMLIRLLGEGPPFGSDVQWVLPYWLIYIIFYLGMGLLLLIWSGRILNPLRKSNIQGFRN